MTPEEDIDLDPILQKHFADHLDGQLGRAGKAFAAHVRAGPVRRARFPWVIPFAAASAAAAMIALAIFPRHSTPHENAGPVASAGESTIEQVVWSRTIDQGTVLLDDQTPARKVVREQIRELRWTDAAGGRHVQTLTPHRDVMLISLDKY